MFLNLHSICCIVLNADVSLCMSCCRILRPKAETSEPLSMLGEEVFGDQVECALRSRKHSSVSWPSEPGLIQYSKAS